MKHTKMTLSDKLLLPVCDLPRILKNAKINMF